MPAELTRRATLRNWFLHEKDGLFNTGRRLDPAATAVELDPLFPATEAVPPLSAVQLAFVRANLRAIGKQVGLKKRHADFLVRMAIGGAKQGDDPAAWRAIRDRKRGPLMEKVQKLLDSLA